MKKIAPTILSIKFLILIAFFHLVYLSYFVPKVYSMPLKYAGTVRKIEEKYKNVRSIKAYFYQKEIIPGYSQNMVFKGYFYYRRNNHEGRTWGMAWIYEYPFHKRQVLKNGRLYIVNDKIKKVTVINVGEERGGFPPNVIEVIGSLTKYFKVENIYKNPASRQIVLVLRPIKMQRAKKIYVGFGDKNLKIKSLKILTYQGQTIKFKYKRVKINANISGKVFNTDFPSYYKIIKSN